MLKKTMFAGVFAPLTALSLSVGPNNASQHQFESTQNRSIAVAYTSGPNEHTDSSLDQAPASLATPKWYGTFAHPDGMLVVVGIITFVIIGWQSWETRKSAQASEKAAQAAQASADATLKSVKLQEAQSKQWLEIRRWKTDAEFPDPHWITLRYEIVNPTNMPLTLRTIHHQGFGGGLPAYDAKWGLSPNGVYPFQIPGIKLAAKELDDFNKGNLTFWAVVTVGFDDAFGAGRTQQFSVECTCGRYRSCETKPRWGTTNPTDNPDLD